MHCHCGTNNGAPRWTFTDPYNSEVRPGAREESASLAWLATPAMNARNTTKVYIWRLVTGCGPTLYRKCHSHNTPGKRYMYKFMYKCKELKRTDHREVQSCTDNSVPKRCNLTNKAVRTISPTLSNPPQRRQGPDSCLL